MKPNSLKHDRLQVLQYFLSLRGVHIPQSRSFPARCVALDPITDTRLLFLHFFGAGLPLAAGGRHCRTGRRMGPQDGPQDDKEWMRQLQPPPPTPASGWGQTYALHKFPALRNAPDVSIFFSLRTNPAYFQVDFRTANFSLGGTLFHHTKSKQSFRQTRLYIRKQIKVKHRKCTNTCIHACCVQTLFIQSS